MTAPVPIEVIQTDPKADAKAKVEYMVRRVVLRLKPGESLSSRQRDVLSAEAVAVKEYWIPNRKYHRQSGAFVMHQESERVATVTRYGAPASVRLIGDGLARFLTGEKTLPGDVETMSECAVRYEDDPPAKEDEPHY